ncbi:hypothetical protein DPMN_128546 [Dreissena polymorpha]|uniref:Uncharacterized protein n=1 Tax=Dreissena polymorpha TaxID=45954 RepID=A0A9D4H7D0_DREPO|nr:hypothetical protein DPMN_128546 [Dreissena polymorpha]
MLEIPRLSAMVPHILLDRRDTCERFPYICDVQRPSGELQETHRQFVTVSDSLSFRRRLFRNLLQVPRRSWNGRRLLGISYSCSPVSEIAWHRHKLSESLLQVPRRSRRLESSESLLQVPRSLGSVADCLGVSCRCLDTLDDCLAKSVSLLLVPRLSLHRRILIWNLLQVP